MQDALFCFLSDFLPLVEGKLDTLFMLSSIKKKVAPVIALLYEKFVFNIYIKTLRIFLPNKFIIQDRPAKHIKLKKIPNFKQLEEVWTSDRNKPATDTIRLYFLCLVLQMVQEKKLHGS